MSDKSVQVKLHPARARDALRETWARGFDLVVAEQYPGRAAPHHAGLHRRLLVGDAIRLAVAPGRPATHPVTRLAGFEPDVRYESADLQVQIGPARPPRCDLWQLPRTPRREIFTSARVAGDRDPALAALRETLHQVAAALPAGDRTGVA